MPGYLATAIREVFAQHEVVSDEIFDQIYPAELRGRSAVHWTPMEVAVRAVHLLAPSAETRVLDVGAGVGKLCAIGALVVGGRWCAVEADPALVDAGTRAARALGVRVTFLRGDVGELDWRPFDALYFYNPFASALEESGGDPIERWSDFGVQVYRAQERLLRARPGTRVVTYHGFGGEMPPGYELVAREPAANDHLELWIRTGPARRWTSVHTG